ncbi:hypothetical protein UB46_22840 [Burkholderiaceae bacterium 16]|nr:hypothetical protein UB46_22840 [Burkholderiaceae bacterium 16]
MIADVHDAQFSMYHGIAVAAHRLRPGKAWLKPEVIHSPSVMRLMAKVTSEPRPDYVKLLTSNAASRPARVQLMARGTTFREEKRYPKGSPSPDPDTVMTDDELIAKSAHNAEGALSGTAIQELVESVMGLEHVGDWRSVMKLACR